MAAAPVAEWRRVMAAVRSGDEGEAVEAVRYWSRTDVGDRSLPTCVATLLTALRRPEPRVEAAAVAGLETLAKRRGDDLAVLVEPFARAQCEKADVADACERGRAAALALCAVAAGSASDGAVDALLDAFAPRLLRVASRADGGGRRLTEPVARLAALRKRRRERASSPAAADPRVTALAAEVAGLFRGGPPPGTAGGGGGGGGGARHIAPDGRGRAVADARAGRYVVTADDAPVLAAASEASEVVGTLPRLKRVVALSIEGEFAFIDAPLEGFLRFEDLAPATEAIGDYALPAPIWTSSAASLAEARGLGGVFAEAAIEAIAAAVAACGRTRRGSAALKRLCAAGVPLNVLRCHATLAKRGLPPRLWGRHRAHAGRRFVAEVGYDACDVDGLWRTYVAAHEPVVIKRAVDVLRRSDAGVCWADLGDDGYLRARCGSRVLAVRGAYCEERAGDARERVFASSATARASLNAVLDERARAASEGSPARFYAAKLALASALPELDDDVRAILRKADDRGDPSAVDKLSRLFGAPHRSGVFAYLAPPGAVTQTHFDPTENLMVVLRGAKRLRLFPPRCARNLEPSNAPLFTVAGLAAPPFSPQFLSSPGLADDVLEVTVTAGDILYLPAGWWHAVASVGASTSLNFWADIHPRKAGDDEDASAVPPPAPPPGGGSVGGP